MADGKTKSPYQRYKKRPYPYTNVPLHQSGAGRWGGVPRGVPVTPENLRRWEESLAHRFGGGR